MPAPAERSAGRRLELALGVLAVLVPLAFHAPFFSSQAIVYQADAAQLQLPRYRVLCDVLQQEHAIPLWQSLLYGGSPFHASPENPTLYPPVLLFAALCTPVLTINLVILSGLAGAALGMYLLVLRLWKRIAAGVGADAAIGPAGAFVGAACFSMNHCTRVDHLNLVAYGHAHALVPWLLLAADALLFGERPRRAAGVLAILIALEVFTGGLYVFPYAVLMVAAWLVFLGLLGGREPRRRAAIWGSIAAGLAGLMILAKLLPYAEWVPTTNRSGTLAYEDALAVTLGGHRAFDWSHVFHNIGVYAGGGWPFVFVLFALPLLRHASVRTVFGLGLFFFAVSLGGPAHRLLYELVPPFDQIRNAVRAWWSAVNPMWSAAAGLGACWFASRSGLLRRRTLLVLLFGVASGLLLAARLFHSTPRHDEVLHHPQRFSELVAHYVHWPEAARRAGSDWRTFYVDKQLITEPDEHNEQFITSALGVETVAGYLGHVWPAALERHVYVDAQGRPYPPEIRHRRLATMSARWFVTNDPSVPPAAPPESYFPVGIDGTAVFDNAIARPRAFAPAAVVAVVGDRDNEVAYALLDDPRFPLQQATVLSLGEDAVLESDEARLMDLGVVVGEAPAWPGSTHVALPLDERGRAELDRVITRVGEIVARKKTYELSFERTSSNECRVQWGAERPPNGAFVVVSEPWSLYTGWRSSTPGPIYAADGISSAVCLPFGLDGFSARYSPLSVALGLAIGLLGLLGAAVLVARR